MKCAPFALFTNTGNAPAHFFIQFIGTPPSSESCAVLYSAADFGCSAANRFVSRSCNCFNLPLSILVLEVLFVGAQRAAPHLGKIYGFFLDSLSASGRAYRNS